MTITFPAGELNTDGTIKKGIVDKSGNLSLAKTITIGIDDPENHEDHKDPDIVDVVNPVWTYGTSSINRIRDGKTADTVELTIIGSDKYYKSNSLTKDKIKVYVDDKLESSITKDLVSITDTATLKQLATISVPEARQLLIKPFDRSCLGAIEKAIFESNLGYTPNNDGETIRIIIPVLTEERRKELTKQVRAMAEDAKVSIRNIRHDANEDIEKEEISEDEQKNLQNRVQDLVNKYNKLIDEKTKEKENELMTV